MMQRLETAGVAVFMLLGAAGFCWNLWDLATTTSHADLQLMASLYFKAAGVMSLVAIPGAAYVFWDHRRTKK